MQELKKIALALVESGKGVLAADESVSTIKKRFDKIGVESTEETRRAYRELLFTTPGIEQYISGVILFDETIRQSTKEGLPFVKLLAQKGIIPGIKVDKGTLPFNGSEVEKITDGLDGLGERLKEYYGLGARFAKWRAVISIGADTPSIECINANAEVMAKYAKLCQENNIVPIVEPEVLMDGGHGIDKCYEVTEMVLKAFFEKLHEYKVALDCLLLKPNMVIPGEDAVKAASSEVASATVKCLLDSVPATVPGIVFLSGGQSEQEACENLDAINKIKQNCPWQLSFSYGRALQSSALKAWSGSNIYEGQQAFLLRAKLTGAARDGLYTTEMESDL